MCDAVCALGALQLSGVWVLSSQTTEWHQICLYQICINAHVLKLFFLLPCGSCSDPKVYEVQRTFTGTKEAWLDAVNAMENGWVSTSVLSVLG